MTTPPLTDAELGQLAGLLTRVRHQWKMAGNPDSRREVERFVRDALTERGNRVMRRAGGVCEECGDPAKDAVIARLEGMLAEAQRTIGAVSALVDHRRATVRAGDLRRALGWGEAAEAPAPVRAPQCPADIPGAEGWYCQECGRARGTYAVPRKPEEADQ